jgi:D-3-phosphoglycerate dehydrogenase / 2-oxoglutarate reductase
MGIMVGQAPDTIAAASVDGTGAMSGAVETLILDMLEWIGREPRPYDEVQEIWRTSCPRLSVWEDAKTRGYLAQTREPGRRSLVCVSAAGAAHLERHRPGHLA